MCIDLEDSVTPDEKAASRAHVVRALKEIDFGRRVRMFRINALDSPFAYRDLVEVVEAAGDRIDLVMVPKVGSARDVQFVETLLTQIEAHARLTRRIGIEVADRNRARLPPRARDRRRVAAARGADLRRR